MSEGEEMDKNVALNRSVCGASKNPSEPKKDNGRSNGNGQSYYKKREPPFSKGGTDAGLQRSKNNPQRSKGFSDKRPRSSKDNNGTGRRDEVTKSQRAEFGSALSHGPKKMNLTHLINFTMAPREAAQDHRGPGGWRGRNKWTQRYPKYNKEQFLQANCQFVVKADCDYSLQCVDADKLVDWELIEQVRILNLEVPSCPICLYPPTAAKITRCGHIYCWTCMLHYLALGEKSWRKCPICYEAVHQKDLKSVVAKATHSYSQGDEITFRLMKREKGSVITQPHSAREYGQLFTIEDDPSTTCMVKMLLASPEQVRDMIIEPERAALMAQLQEKNGDLEDSFSEAALKMIEEREQGIFNVHKMESLIPKVVGLNLENNSEKEKVSEEPVAALSPPCKNYKHYASAFSDEEQDPLEEPSHSPHGRGFTIEEPFEDHALSGAASDVTGAPSPSAFAGAPDVIGYQTPDGAGATASPCITAERQSPDSLGGASGARGGSISEDCQEMIDEGRGSPAPPLQEGIGEPGSKSDGKGHVYYFYQAEDGQHLYLHSLNVRCLIREYGSFSKCPETITAKVVEVDHMSMNETLRRRLRYLFHLPLTCEFGICELDFKSPLISKATLQYFAGEFQQRKKAREKKSRNEKRQERKMQIKENRKNGKHLPPKFSLQSSSQFPSFGVDSMQAGISSTPSETASSVASLDSPVSSSLGSPFSLSQEEASHAGQVPVAHFGPDSSESAGGPSSVVGSWASAGSMEDPAACGPSFAQMLREGKSKPESAMWPRIVKAGGGSSRVTDQPSGETRRRKTSTQDPDGSDNSSNEDYAPVPQYKDAFSDAIQAALDKAAVHAAIRKTDARDDVTSSPGTGKRGKKGKKKQQQLLFSTAGPRFK